MHRNIISVTCRIFAPRLPNSPSTLIPVLPHPLRALLAPRHLVTLGLHLLVPNFLNPYIRYSQFIFLMVNVELKWRENLKIWKREVKLNKWIKPGHCNFSCRPLSQVWMQYFRYHRLSSFSSPLPVFVIPRGFQLCNYLPFKTSPQPSPRVPPKPIG